MSALPSKQSTESSLKESDWEHLWHPMSSPFVTQKTSSMVLERADGVYVWDTEGNRYFDAVGGLWCVNVGHNRPEMKQAIIAQLDQLEFHNIFAGKSHPQAIKLSHRIIELLSDDGMERVFFSSGGSDANDTAIKIARQYWQMQGKAQRTKLFSLKDCYHGMHVGGTSLTGSAMLRNAFGPLLPGCFQVDTPNIYRNPWTEDPEELGQICADILEREIVQQGPDTVAAFFVEPVIGIGGVIVPPANYFPLVRKVCNKYDVLMIADEVVTGFGRTGAMSGSRVWGVQPDIMCLAKGLTSGYIPMGATAVNGKIADVMESTPPPNGLFLHGYTYSGHPIACAAAMASLDIVEREDLPGNAKTVGAYLLEKLKPLERYAHVGDVRGKGLMAIIEMVEDKKTKAALAPNSKFGVEIGDVACQHGALVRAVGSLIILSPPLITTKEHVDELVDAIDAAFNQVDTLSA